MSNLNKNKYKNVMWYGLCIIRCAGHAVHQICDVGHLSTIITIPCRSVAVRITDRNKNLHRGGEQHIDRIG